MSLELSNDSTDDVIKFIFTHSSRAMKTLQNFFKRLSTNLIYRLSDLDVIIVKMPL